MLASLPLGAQRALRLPYQDLGRADTTPSPPPTAAKQKRKTTRPPPSATTSPVLNANEEPSSTNPDIDPFNPFTLKHEDQEGDDTAPGSSTKSKKPLSSASASAVAPAAAPTPTPPPASAASTGKKTSAPVSSSSSTSKNATSTTAPRSKDKNLSASLKVEDEEEQVQEGQEEDAAPPPPPRPVEKRGSARAATRPQTKKPVVEEPEEESEEEEEDDEEGGDGGVTRCVCDEDSEFAQWAELAALSSLRLTFALLVLFAAEEMASGLMIQCDTCKCWQHGQCVGLWNEKVSCARATTVWLGRAERWMGRGGGAGHSGWWTCRHSTCLPIAMYHHPSPRLVTYEANLFFAPLLRRTVLTATSASNVDRDGMDLEGKLSSLALTLRDKLLTSLFLADCFARRIASQHQPSTAPHPLRPPPATNPENQPTPLSSLPSSPPKTLSTPTLERPNPDHLRLLRNRNPSNRSPRSGVR